MIGDKKGIYHSTLVHFGPARVTVKSDVLKSKKGDSYFVILEHEGQEQYYNIENAECAEPFKGRKGQDITIKGTGSRDDARIEIEGVTERKTEQPQQVSPEKALDVASDEVARVMNAFYLIMQSADNLRGQSKVDGVEMTDDQFQAICSSAFIHLDRQGLIASMPTTPVWSKNEQT
jgi:hypothetical protein